MNDPRRIASIACFMLVTLRLMIGWQLLYEGFWKIKTLKSPTPWTAAGYLKNSKGPLRDHFRKLAGDPDDLSWITAAKINPKEENPERVRYWVPAVEDKWDAWRDRFVKHYGLSDGQQKRLELWLNGATSFKTPLASEPDLSILGKDGKKLSYDADGKLLVINEHLLPDVRAKMEKAIDGDSDGIPDAGDVTPDGKLPEDLSTLADADKDGISDEADVDETGGEDTNKNGIDDSHAADGQQELLASIGALFKRSKDGLSYKKKLRATVAGNPEWIEDKKQQRLGEINKYKTMLASYEEDLAEAKSATSEFPFSDKSFRFDHLNHTWGEIQSKRAELIGPVKALDKELKDKAEGLLSIKQLKRGALPEPWTPLRISDMMTIAGLTILGAMLILGLCTRLAAVMAAVMLFMFYAAMPPWPGVPAIPGPEHSFIVNKNFIEVVALLAIACLPTGRWWGLDGMLGRIWGLRKTSQGRESGLG